MSRKINVNIDIGNADEKYCNDCPQISWYYSACNIFKSKPKYEKKYDNEGCLTCTVMLRNKSCKKHEIK